MAVTEHNVNSQPAYSFLTGFRGRKVREAIQAYLFLLPGTLLLFVFSLFPIGYAFYISLHKWRIQKGDFIGFENFIKALGSPLDILYVVGGLLLLGISWTIWKKITAEDSTGFNGIEGVGGTGSHYRGFGTGPGLSQNAGKRR